MIKRIKRLHSKLNQAVFRASVFAGVLVTTLMWKVEYAFAGSDIDFLKNGEGNATDTFNQLNETAKGVGFSAFNLMRTLGLIGFAISLLGLAMSHSFTKNANKKGENKSHFGDICIGMMVFFGVFAIIGWAKYIAEAIAN